MVAFLFYATEACYFEDHFPKLKLARKMSLASNHALLFCNIDNRRTTKTGRPQNT